MHLISDITDGWQGCEPPLPAKLNVKTGPLPSLYFGIYYSFGFRRLLFFYVFGMFSGEFGFLYSGQYRIGFSLVSQLFSEC